jgi:purine-nucleoside phosphorylase
MSAAEANAEIIRDHAGNEPISIALVLGSGLSGIGNLLNDRVEIPYSELVGFPTGGVSGHGKSLLIGELSGKRIAILTGRAHYYEDGNSAVMRTPLETMQAVGVHTLLLTNSAGSLEKDIQPGELMLISDHINYNGLNPLIGEETDKRFVNMVDAYDPKLRQQALSIADEMWITLKEGVYAWYSGPTFETPAEIRMIKGFGANAVGMSTVPEAILARFLGLRVWACSSITNMGAGLSDENISHQHTKEMALKGAKKLEQLIERLVREI